MGRPLSLHVQPLPGRLKVVGRVADHCAGLLREHPLRVAVESGPGSGGAVFAIHLCSALASRGVTAILVTAADFPDLTALATDVLAPLGPGGRLRYRERPGGKESRAPASSVLVVEGSRLPPAGAGGDALVDQVVHVYGQQPGPAAASATCLVGNADPDHPDLRRIGGPAGSKVLLFSYGTLQKPAVQEAVFGRRPQSTTDVLMRYETETVTIGDPDVVAASGTNRHPAIRPTHDYAATVEGTVMLITTEELARADLFEVVDLRRTLVRLASGAHAWAFTSP